MRSRFSVLVASLGTEVVLKEAAIWKDMLEILRKAAEKAWKPPSREVALMRLRRAEAMGLDYRDYVGVMLDRGRSLCVLGRKANDRPSWPKSSGLSIASARSVAP